MTIPEAETIRHQIAAVLKMMSVTRDGAVATDIPVEKLAFELCRLWMEDLYAPGRRNVDGFRAQYDMEAESTFNECYDEDELFKLERFHRFLELRVDMLRKARTSDESFPVNDAWQQLARDAGYLLDDLEPDFELTRHHIDTLKLLK